MLKYDERNQEASKWKEDCMNAPVLELEANDTDVNRKNVHPICTVKEVKLLMSDCDLISV